MQDFKAKAHSKPTNGAATGKVRHDAAASPRLIPGGAARFAPENADKVASLLAPLACELTALSVNGKQAHWHVRGANFMPVHELLDDIIDHTREWADTAAERLVALGIPLDATLTTIAKNTALPEFPQGFLDSDTVIEHYVTAIDIVVDFARRAVDLLGGLDPASQDVVIEILRGLEKDRWFLSYSHSNPQTN